MPELPEVQMMVNSLITMVLNSYIEDVSIRKTAAGRELSLAKGQKIIEIFRFGKAVYFQLSRDAIMIEPGSHSAFHFQPNEAKRVRGACVIFRTSQGTLSLMQSSRNQRVLFVLKDQTCVPDVGVDPLTKRMSAKHLRRCLRLSSSTIKDFLIRDKIIAGIGPRYAKTILIRTRIDPQSEARSITGRKAKSLFGNIKQVISEAMAYRCPQHIGVSFPNPFNGYTIATGEKSDKQIT
ncbi:MAG: hypothetical protein HZC28_14075 [Spirochaetes bacterium]|nr:hypothetical protein [Spirochaetota bacterium]